MWPTAPGANNLGSVLGSLGMNLGMGGMGYPALNMPPSSAPGTPNVGGATPGAAGFYNGLPRTTVGAQGSSLGYPAMAGPPGTPATMPPMQNPQSFGNIGAGLGYPAYGMPASAPPPVLPGGAPAMFGPSTFPPPSPSPTRSVAGPTISARPGAAVTRGVSGSSVSGAIPPTARAQAPTSPFGYTQYGVQRGQPITTTLMLNRLFGR